VCVCINTALFKSYYSSTVDRVGIYLYYLPIFCSVLCDGILNIFNSCYIHKEDDELYIYFICVVNYLSSHCDCAVLIIQQ